MIQRWRIALAALLVLLLSAGYAVAQIELPELTRPVTDLTGTLSKEEIASLETAILSLQKEKGSQIAVLIIASTAPEVIEQFGIRLAESWKIGRAKVDDGVILIVAKDDRAMRIEVGYGLEGAIPDAIAKRIIEERIIPQFRAGNFFSGIEEGVNALAAIIRGEELPPPAETGSEVDLREAGLIFLLIVGSFVCAALTGKLGRVKGTVVGSSIMGVLAIPFIGLVSALFLFVFLLTIGLGPKGGGGSRRGRGLGGSSWSSGSSSGGFSGGGGSFGGGGASGRW